MLSLPFFPYDYGHGILQPYVNELIVSNVYFDETVAANDVVQFDTDLVVATAYNTDGLSSGVSTSAWGRVRLPDVSTATHAVNETAVYGHTAAAVTAANRANVTVIGDVTCTKVTGSAAHTLAQDFCPSMADPGDVTVNAAIPGTFVVTCHLRKIVLKATTAATAATVPGKFNGFGWGLAIKNIAYANDVT